MRRASYATVLAVFAAMVLTFPLTQAAERTQEQARLGQATEWDKLFVERAAIHNRFDQKLSEAAAQQAQDQQVKQFAQRIAQDHANLEAQIKRTAEQLGVTIAAELPQQKQRELDAIKALQGRDFDQAYLSTMKAGHLADVSKCADQAQIAKSQEVRQLAQQLLPGFRQHQQEVISLAAAQGLPSPMIGEAVPAAGQIRPGEPQYQQQDQQRQQQQQQDRQGQQRP